MGKQSQGWYGQFEQPDYADIADSVFVTLLELRMKAMELTGTSNPPVERADHDIARLRSLKIAGVREALTRLAKEGKIVKLPSEDASSMTVQVVTKEVEATQADPEVEELLRKKDHQIKELNEFIQRISVLNDRFEKAGQQHELDMETQQGKLDTANNRARKAREELRETRERLEGQLGALRRELQEVRQSETQCQQQLEAMEQRLRTAEAELNERRAADAATVVDILPEDMSERFVRAVQT